MTRIKYQKANGWLFSQDFLCNTKIARISLDMENLRYYIISGKETLKEGKANTLASLKKKAKQAAKDLGATFYDEIRNRGKIERFDV